MNPSLSELRQRIEGAEDRLRREAQELARVLLPELSEEALQRARRWTGLDFLGPNLLENVERDRRDIETSRCELESHPDFARSPAAQIEAIETERQRLEGHKQALVPLLRACEADPRFTELVKKGYGTGRYRSAFWRLSFYRDRSDARDLCRRAGKKSFAELVEDYRQAVESFDVLQQRLQELKSAYQRSPRKLWEQLGQRLDKLEAVHLNTAQSRLQLALIKGGNVWGQLERSGDLPRDLKLAVNSACLLHDQLEELRRQRMMLR